MGNRLFIELQLQRAWTDLWALMRAQGLGVAITLLGAALTAPAVALINHADFSKVFLTILAQSLAGPVLAFIIAFAIFFLRAPGHLHREALNSDHTLQKNEKFSFSVYPASSIAALFIATLLSAFLFWLAAHLALVSSVVENSQLRRDLEQAQTSARSWKRVAESRAPAQSAAPLPAINSGKAPSQATTVSSAKPHPPEIALAEPPAVPAKIAPTFVPLPAAPTSGPRNLSLDQQRFLVAALSPISGKVSRSVIIWVPNDNETYSYSSDFQRVFVRAGLQPTWVQMNPANPSELGVMLEIEKDTPKDLTLTIKGIFEKAGIAVKLIERPNQSLGAPLILFIGPQPL